MVFKKKSDKKKYLTIKNVSKLIYQSQQFD